MSKNVQYEEMFPWQIAEVIAKTPIAYLPLGALEWHGEHNAVGLDVIKAHNVCIQAARISGGVVVPPIYWATDSREDLPDGSYLTGGVEHGERYHVPGNMFWLRPQTYLDLLLDVYETIRRRGFRVIVVVAGHWSRTTSPVQHASVETFSQQHPEIKMLLLTDQEAVSDLDYPHEHAAGAETSILMAVRPDLVDLEKTFETNRALKEYYSAVPQHLKRRQETSYKYIGVLTAMPDGANDPELSSSPERGWRLLKTIATRIAAQAQALLVEFVDEDC